MLPRRVLCRPQFEAELLTGRRQLAAPAEVAPGGGPAGQVRSGLPAVRVSVCCMCCTAGKSLRRESLLCSRVAAVSCTGGWPTLCAPHTSPLETTDGGRQ
jgi:hypothetical protein